MTTLSPAALRRGLLATVAVAFAGSAWAAGFVTHCSACDATADLVPGMNLGLIGLAYYGALLALLWAKGASRPAIAAIQAAVGVHVALVSVLVSRGIFCPPCALTAAAALAAFGFAMMASRANRRLALTVVPVAAVLATLAVGAVRTVAERKHARALDEAVAHAVEGPVPSSREARIVVYFRTGCHVCREFDEDVLPQLVEAFGDSIAVEHVPAGEGLKTPTIVVIGKRTPILFEGLPSTAEIVRSIHDAIG